MTATRGERNNNPGNIREYPGDHTLWRGERSTDDDPEFEEFDTPDAGIRALAKILIAYNTRYGIRTVRGYISRWAPGNENDTEAYIHSVARRMGVGDVEAININDRFVLQKLVTAIIWHENGRCIYPNDQVAAAVNMAFA